MEVSTHSPGFAAQFVAQVLDDALVHGCRVYGIAGLQGSGKSTLSAQVARLASTRGLRCVVLSIDDFYLGRRERQRLGRTVHPLCATRGPPGTHEVPLACDVLDALCVGRATRLPRFDKIDDKRLPPSRWPQARGADPGSGPGLVILEGWFLQVPAQTAAELTRPLNALERDEDRDGTWRHWCNEALGHDYPPLWRRLDRLLFLHGPGFEVVPDWRWQQEVTLQAVHPRRQTMTRPQVSRFVQFFERVSRHALHTLPGIAPWTVQLDASREIIQQRHSPASGEEARK